MSFDMIKTFNYFKLLLRWRKRIFHKFFNFGMSRFLVNNCNYLNNCQFFTETCHYRSQNTCDSLTIASAVYLSICAFITATGFSVSRFWRSGTTEYVNNFWRALSVLPPIPPLKLSQHCLCFRFCGC